MSAQASTSESPDPPLTRWYPLAIFVLALAWVLDKARDKFTGDEWRYVWYAKNILQGFYTPSDNEMVWNGPAYPLWLLPFVATGTPLIVPKLLNAALLALAVLYLHRTLRRYVSPVRASVGGLVLGLSPLSYQNLHLVYTETMAVFLMTGLVFHFCASRAEAEGSRRHAVIAGLFLGSLVLTKVSFGPPMLIGLALTLSLWALGRRTPLLRSALEAGLVAFAMCVPWLLYTRHMSGKWFYWASGAGQLIYWMTSPYKEELGEWFHHGQVRNVPMLREHHGRVYEQMIGDLGEVAGTDLERMMPGVGRLCGIKADLAFWQIGFRQFREHPENYLRNWFFNVGRLFFDHPYTLKRKQYSMTLVALHLVLLGAVAAVGFRRLRGRLTLPPEVEALAIFALVSTAISTGLGAVGRYFLPLYPAFLLVAIVGTSPDRWQPAPAPDESEAEGESEGETEAEGESEAEGADKAKA